MSRRRRLPNHKADFYGAGMATGGDSGEEAVLNLKDLISQ
jgi:hypothetical protein